MDCFNDFPSQMVGSGYLSERVLEFLLKRLESKPVSPHSLNYKNGRARHRSSLVELYWFSKTRHERPKMCITSSMASLFLLLLQLQLLICMHMRGYNHESGVTTYSPQMWGDCGDGQCSNYDWLYDYCRRKHLPLPTYSFSQAYLYTTTTKFAYQRRGSTRIRREDSSLVSVYGVRLLKGGHDISVTQLIYVSRVHARNPLLSPTLLSLAFAFDLGPYTLRTTWYHPRIPIRLNPSVTFHVDLTWLL
jgi:hypothetical protein